MSFIQVKSAAVSGVFPCSLPARDNIARLSLGWSKFLSSPVHVPIGSKTRFNIFYLQPITDMPVSALHHG